MFVFPENLFSLPSFGGPHIYRVLQNSLVIFILDNRLYIVAERVVYVRAPRRERAEKIDLDVFFDSAFAAGAIAVIYFLGWPLVQSLMKGDLKLPDLSNLKLPTFPQLGSRLPSTGGGVSSGSTWYKATGAQKSMPTARCDGESNRWENITQGFGNGFEVVVYFTVPKGSMQSGSHIGLKHGGPNHGSDCQHKQSGPCGGSGCCCWWDGGLRRNGDSYLEVEGPHPNNCKEKMFGNIGRPIDNGETLGVRWLIEKQGSGVHLMQWVDTSGKVGANQWKETYDVVDTGQFMIQSYFSKITAVQNIEIRISDIPCKSIKMDYGPFSRKI